MTGGSGAPGRVMGDAYGPCRWWPRHLSQHTALVPTIEVAARHELSDAEWSVLHLGAGPIRAQRVLMAPPKARWVSDPR